MNRTWVTRGLGILSVIAVIAGLAYINKSEDTVLSSSTTKTEPNLNLEVSGWLPYWDDGKGLATFKANAGSFKEIHPFWYEAQSATDIATQGNASFRNSTLAAIKKSDAKNIPTLTEKMNTADFLAILKDETARAQHTGAVCSLVTKNNFAGIDIDYESFVLNLTSVDAPAAAPLFSNWLGELATCLHSHKKELQVTVLPRTADPRWAYFEDHLAVAVFDYAAIGEVADRIRPMAYDFSYPGSSPGSVDPIEWVKAVIKYTTDRVAANKVDLGVPLYGYDWLTRGRAITAASATALAVKNNITPTRDAATQSLTFNYVENGNSRTVWFDDTQATAMRVDLARQAGLHGVTFWAMGQQQIDSWPALSAY